MRSQSGIPDNCIIDCQADADNPNIGFYFIGEPPGQVLQGVTVTRGYSDAQGIAGGVHCAAASPTFIDCILSQNVAEFGGGMGCRNSSSPTLTNCAFIGNSYPWGGGMFCERNSSPTLTDCRFEGNEGHRDAGIACDQGCSPSLTNTVIAFNHSGEAVLCLEANSNPTLACCDVYGNAGGDWVGCIEDQYGSNGNIAEDPIFCDPVNGELTIRSDSPCAPFSPPKAFLFSGLRRHNGPPSLGFLLPPPGAVQLNDVLDRLVGVLVLRAERSPKTLVAVQEQPLRFFEASQSG